MLTSLRDDTPPNQRAQIKASPHADVAGDY